MGLPGVYIDIQNGALGSTPSTNDGIAGMVISGVAVVSGVQLDTSYQIFSLKEAEALGITEQADIDNSIDTWKQIFDFYKTAGNGAELWFMLVAQTITMEDMADITKTYLPKLLNDAKGKIRIVAIGRYPDVAYNPPQLEGLDPDVWASLSKMQETALDYQGKIKPFRAIIGGRHWTGSPGDLKDLKTLDKNTTGIIVAGIGAGSAQAGVGLALGQLAYIPVQRNIGRKKNGPVEDIEAYLTDGNTVTNHELHIASIHDKGYLTLRQYVNVGGFFYTDDPTATSNTDDYSSIARGRVIDKALTLTYITYIEEVNEEVEINDDGTIDAGYIKALQSNIENVIGQAMTAKKEISAVKCTINPAQNVLSTNKIEIDLKITPVGYAKEILVRLGFSNPALNQ